MNSIEGVQIGRDIWVVLFFFPSTLPAVSFLPLRLRPHQPQALFVYQSLSTFAFKPPPVLFHQETKEFPPTSFNIATMFSNFAASVSFIAALASYTLAPVAALPSAAPIHNVHRNIPAQFQERDTIDSRDYAKDSQYLEPYTIYHTRYMEFDCEDKHGDKVFFACQYFLSCLLFSPLPCCASLAYVNSLQFRLFLPLLASDMSAPAHLLARFGCCPRRSNPLCHCVSTVPNIRISPGKLRIGPPHSIVVTICDATLLPTHLRPPPLIKQQHAATLS